MAEKLLTDLELRRATPRPREYLLGDGGSLYARVRATRAGTAAITWQFFFKWERETERLSIGPYPEVTLQEARRRRDEARELLKCDPPRHPVIEARARAEAARARAAAEASERTLRGVFDDWRRVYLAHHRKDAGEQVLQYFERDVFPLLGTMRARAVGRTQITAVLDRILERNARTTANKVLGALKQFFKWAHVRGAVDQDPTLSFTRGHAGGKEKRRERVLSFDELGELAVKLPASDLREPYKAAVRFILATGPRVNELNLAKWPEIDHATRIWRIPAENAKNGREHLVHLSAFALGELAILARHRVGVYVMPSRNPQKPLYEKAIAKMLRDRQRRKSMKNRTRAVDALRLAGGRWSPHDLRRTLSTRMADLQVPPHVIERCLNHTMQGVMAVYNLNDYASERRVALDAWGARLADIFATAGASQKVEARPPREPAKRHREHDELSVAGRAQAQRVLVDA